MLLLPRPSVVAAADGSATIFLMVAGPGAGKSCAARLLAQAWNLPLYWWPAGELQAALAQKEGASLGPAAEALATERWNAVGEAHPQGACVVVDAVDAGGEEALAFLRAWLALPAPGPLVVTSRTVVPLAWGPHLKAGRLRAMGPKDLWVGQAELLALAAAFGQEPGPLLRGMGGWPLGLFALLRQGEADEAFALDLVNESWLEPLPPECLRALGPLSLWPEVDDAVLNALGLGYVRPWALGEPEAEATLPFLLRWGLLQGDAVGRMLWVPWVRVALQARWREGSSLEVQAQTEGLAAAWLKEHDPLAAVRALLARGAVREAVALVGPWGDRLVGAQDWAGLASLLNALPLPFRISQPTVLMLESSLLQVQGEVAEAMARCEAAAALFELEGDEASAQRAAQCLLRLREEA